MRFIVFLLSQFAIMSLIGCATPDVSQHPDFKAATQDAFNELSEMNRTPAADQNTSALKQNFDKLRYQAKYLVFPKTSNLTDKTSDPVDKMYWSPKTFNVAAPLLLSCKSIKKFSNKNFNHQIFFANAPDDKKCAVLKYTFNERINYSVVSLDDILEARVYIDSDYRGYGVEYVKFKGRNTPNEVVAIKMDSRFPVTSGLTFIPSDIPVIDILKPTMGAMTVTDDKFVQKKLTQIGVAKTCSSAANYSYRETFGSIVNGSWCSGDPLPTKIDTARYLAVLRKK